MRVKRFGRAGAAAMALVLSAASVAVASNVDVAVVDVTAPTNSVTLAPGGNSSITINMSVSGNQAGTATFEVYRNWNLSGRSFVGSNPQEFTVAPRNGGDPATTFSTSGTVSIATGHAEGSFTLAIAAFDITNTNATGAKLQAGDSSNYTVTVSAPTDACASVSAPAAPVFATKASNADGANGWFVSIPIVSASSATAGATITYSTNGTDFSATAPTLAQGTTTVTAKATSATCNKTSQSSETFNVDTVAPEVNPASVVNSTWRKTDLSQAFTASDGTSGLANSNDASFTLTATAESANATTPTVASHTVYDNAGNSTSRSVSALIDLTKPTISGSTSPDPNGNGWNNTNVTVSFSCGDALSGVATCPGDVTLDADGAGQSVTRSATDNAGNSNSASVSGINIDKTAPSVSLVGGPVAGATYYFGSVPAAPTCSASDVTSGLPSGTISPTGYSTAVGNHTVSCSATDNAGNQASDSASYTVLAWSAFGFYSPVDMGSTVLNSVKGGQTVPLKFEVFAANELTSTSIVSFFKTRELACGTFAAATIDDVEITTTGSTSLRYDSTGGQFIQNWQTPKTTGKCYAATVGLVDGSTITAYFKTK